MKIENEFHAAVDDYLAFCEEVESPHMIKTQQQYLPTKDDVQRRLGIPTPLEKHKLYFGIAE